jgi:hypothetical protein
MQYSEMGAVIKYQIPLMFSTTAQPTTGTQRFILFLMSPVLSILERKAPMR